jgi:hypothetical protein
MAVEGVVHIGPFDAERVGIIREYYERCGRETVGPVTGGALHVANQIPLSAILTFDTFEELVDNLLKRSEWVQVVVCHGRAEDGMLVRLCRGGHHDATGHVMGDLALLAKQMERGSPKVDPPDFAGRLKAISEGMGVSEADARRVAEKLGALHTFKKCIIEIRGCNIGGATTMADFLPDYRAAFGKMTTAPKCRMLYLRIEPFAATISQNRGRPIRRGRRPTSIAPDLLLSTRNLPGIKTGIATRRRVFPPDKCQEDEILIAVTDFDGHTHVEGNAWMTKPKNLIHWATQLLSTWRMGASNRFVLPVMWDNADTTFYLPLEAGYCQKLRIIP